VIAIRTEVINNIDIAPAPRIPKDDESGPLEYWKEERIYSQDAPYPAEPVKVSSLMKIRGLDAVMLGITPFQYNPVSRQLTIYRDLKVRIRFQGGNGHFGDDRLRSRWWDPILEDAIFNYPAFPKINYDLQYQKANTEDDGAEYLIITPMAPVCPVCRLHQKFRTEQGISPGENTHPGWRKHNYCHRIIHQQCIFYLDYPPALSCCWVTTVRISTALS
jgi:hypothetical protein